MLFVILLEKTVSSIPIIGTISQPLGLAGIEVPVCVCVGVWVCVSVGVGGYVCVCVCVL